MSGGGAGPADEPSFSLEDLSLLLKGRLKKKPKLKSRPSRALTTPSNSERRRGGGGGGASAGGALPATVRFARRGGVKGKGKGLLRLPSLTGGREINSKGQRFGQQVEIESRSGPVLGIYYAPPRNAVVKGLVVCAPGSGGGLGPGLDLHPSKLAWYNSKAGEGGIFARLGIELSLGCNVDWAYRDKEPPPDAGSDGGVGGFACVQMDYTTVPKWNLYRKDVLGSAVGNLLAVVEWLVERHQKPNLPNLKVIIAGFSFGGPTVLAAVPRISRTRLAGVACLAGSSRGGANYTKVKLDSDRGIRAASKKGVPVLVVHGSHDVNVDPKVGRHHFDVASEPKRFVWLIGADHMMPARRDHAYRELKQWVLAVFDRGADSEELHGTVEWGEQPAAQVKLPRPRGPSTKKSSHPLAGILGYSEG